MRTKAYKRNSMMMTSANVCTVCLSTFCQSEPHGTFSILTSAKRSMHLSHIPIQREREMLHVLVVVWAILFAGDPMLYEASRELA